MNIGLDFGMTNSTISFFDKESNGLTNFKPDAAAEYIPTIIAYNKNRSDEILIGNAAKAKLTSKSYDTYENFKLHLGKRFDKVIDGKNKTPKDVAHDFIKKLLESFQNQYRDIQSIVMTVPNIWIGEESNKTARDNIKDIFSFLGYDGKDKDGKDKFRLVSEPIAAAAYFCYAYENIDYWNTNHSKQPYNGFITVIDYGGGTLDVTLCKVINGKISVLDGKGLGEDNQTNGQAGVAFDEAVIEKLINDNNLSIDKNSIRFIKLRNSFEEQKISECPKITKLLKMYFSGPTGPAIVKKEVLFPLVYNDDIGEEINVYCEDLVDCFNRINAPILHDSLIKIQQFLDANSIDSNDQNNFRILLVGGFSNFFAVEAEVKKYFAPKTKNKSSYDYEDKRFEQPFPPINRSFAISKGAALIAQEMVDVEYLCPYKIGYFVPNYIEEDKYIMAPRVVIEKDTKISTIKEPKYLEKPSIEFSHEFLKQFVKLVIFIDDGRPNEAGLSKAALDEKAVELFPNISKAENKYSIGFSVDENYIPTIYIKDINSGDVKPTPLNKWLEKIAIREVH